MAHRPCDFECGNTDSFLVTQIDTGTVLGLCPQCLVLMAVTMAPDVGVDLLSLIAPPEPEAPKRSRKPKPKPDAGPDSVELTVTPDDGPPVKDETVAENSSEAADVVS